MDIEQFIKDHPERDGEGKSPLEMFGEFLRGEDISSTPDSGPEEAITVVT